MAYQVLTNRIASLKETAIRMDQSAREGKLIPNLENLSQTFKMMAGMMEDLEDRVSRLESRSS